MAIGDWSTWGCDEGETGIHIHVETSEGMHVLLPLNYSTYVAAMDGYLATLALEAGGDGFDEFIMPNGKKEHW